MRFDSPGFAMRGTDPNPPHRGRLASAVPFATTDSRYPWLNTTLELWEGVFDERSGQAGYRAYRASRSLDIVTGIVDRG